MLKTNEENVNLVELFEVNEMAMPITMQQFEDITNEILVEINRIASPHGLDANYMAQILMSALHAYDHKDGIVKKSDLLSSCINRISCHVTYHAVQEIQKKMNIEKDEESDDGLGTVLPLNGIHTPEEH
jgi:hypothetical protein